MPLNAVPQANQTLAQTQNPILQNFATIDAGFSVNHVELGTAGAGKHKFLQLPEQIAAPITAANEAAFYSAQGATSGVTELIFKRESNPGTVIPMTEFIALSATNGWTYLPSGIILQWGTATMNGGVSQLDFNLPRAFPTAFYSITATPNNTPTGNYTDIIMAVQVLSLTQARAKRKSNFGTACSFNFFAIGI